jgi:hypothetical protein
MKWKETTQHENPEPGTHVARCIGLIDMGTQPVSWQGQTKYQRKVLITWELPEHLMNGEFKPECKGKPFAVSRRFTQSLAGQSALKATLESWRGKKFSKEDLSGFDPKSILGKPCLLTLIESEDGAYINIDSVAPLPKTMKCPPQVNASKYFSLELEEFDGKVLESFSDGLKEKIKATPEFRAIMAPPEPDADEMPEESGDSPVDSDREPF